MIKIYIANLGKYNEGELVGEWVTLPVTEKELQDVFCRIKLGFRDSEGDYHHGYIEKDENGCEYVYEEYAIHDYEAPFEINEYVNIYKLNELAQQLEELEDYQKKEVELLLATNEVTFEESLDAVQGQGIEYKIYYNCTSMADVAYNIYEETGMINNIPEELQHYIDWDRLGKDMEIEGNFYYVGNNVYVELIK